ISGDDTKKRKGFRRMVTDAGELADFKAILCWDRKRFGRFDGIEYGFYAHQLRGAGVVLVTVREGLIDWNVSTDRIVAAVHQEGAHEDLVGHSANVARGQLGAALDGSWIGSPPYAYRVVGDRKKKRLVIDDYGKVKIVQRIFQEFVNEGRSSNEIAMRLNA